MRFGRRSELLLSVLLSVGCSSGNGDTTGGSQAGAGQGGAAGVQSTAGSQSVGGSATGGVGGSSGGASGGSLSGAGTGGIATVGGASGGVGGSGGASAGASQGGGGGTASAGPFTCTMMLGLFTTSQWFNGTNPGGASKTFLQDGVDATKWEGKMQKYSYIEKWADPANGLWDIPTATPCAMNPTAPDRALFVGFSPGIPADQDYDKYNAETKDQAGWETQLNLVITNIKTKYPSVKEIDILTMGRAPNNTLCSNNNDIDTIIAPYEDAAFDAVAAASNGLVKVGPKYFVPDCQTSYIFANDSDYTTTAANYLATEVATYYVAHP